MKIIKLMPFAFLTLALAACGDESAPKTNAASATAERAAPAQPAARRVPEENSALGLVRWDGHEQHFNRLSCSLSGYDFLILAHAEAFRFRMGFRGMEGGDVEQVDFSQSRDVEMVIGDGPRFDRDSYLALGEHGEVRLAEPAGPGGARGTARLLPGTGNAPEKHPDGLEIEFEINCP